MKHLCDKTRALRQKIVVLLFYLTKAKPPGVAAPEGQRGRKNGLYKQKRKDFVRLSWQLCLTFLL
jgi:hypothetical protein